MLKFGEKITFEEKVDFVTEGYDKQQIELWYEIIKLTIVNFMTCECFYWLTKIWRTISY